MMPFGRNRCF